MIVRTGMVTAAVLLTASFQLAALDPSEVKRGSPERQGTAWVEQDEVTMAVQPGGRLVLRTDVGAIHVKPQPTDQFQCHIRLKVYTRNRAEAEKYLRRFEVTAKPLEGAGVYIEASGPMGRNRCVPLDAEFEVLTPTRFNLDLDTGGGDIEVAPLDGKLTGESSGGNIRVGDITGPVRVKTAGGNIFLADVGQRLDASTAGGNIRVGNVKADAKIETSGGEIVIGHIEGSARVETAGGDILLRSASGPVIAETAGGQILLGNCGGMVRASTAGGSIRLEGARGPVEAETAGGSLDLFQLQSAVRASTAAGRIVAQIAASRDSFAPSKLESEAGDVKVYLPPDLPLNIEALIDEAAGHGIASDFPLNISGDQQDFGPRTVQARGALNGGGKELRIHTEIGNIEIRKFTEAVLQQLRQLESAQDSMFKARLNHWLEREKMREERRKQKQQDAEKQ